MTRFRTLKNFLKSICIFSQCSCARQTKDPENDSKENPQSLAEETQLPFTTSSLEANSASAPPFSDVPGTSEQPLNSNSFNDECPTSALSLLNPGLKVADSTAKLENKDSGVVAMVDESECDETLYSQDKNSLGLLAPGALRLKHVAWNVSTTTVVAVVETDKNENNEQVHMRWTTDDWRTYADTPAIKDVVGGDYIVKLQLTPCNSIFVEFALYRTGCNGATTWDNNCEKNYRFLLRE